VKTTSCFPACYVAAQLRSGRSRFISLFIITILFVSATSFFRYCYIAIPIKKYRRTISSQLQVCRIVVNSILKKNCLGVRFPLCKRSYSRWKKYFFSSILYTIIFDTLPLPYPAEAYMKNYEKPTNLTIAYQIGFLR